MALVGTQENPMYTIVSSSVGTNNVLVTNPANNPVYVSVTGQAECIISGGDVSVNQNTNNSAYFIQQRTVSNTPIVTAFTQASGLGIAFKKILEVNVNRKSVVISNATNRTFYLLTDSTVSTVKYMYSLSPNTSLTLFENTPYLGELYVITNNASVSNQITVVEFNY